MRGHEPDVQGPYRSLSVYPRRGERINESLVRLQVPGGWVVYSSSSYTSVCFVPDAAEHWILEAKPDPAPTKMPTEGAPRR
jgi:hypothetical protein